MINRERHNNQSLLTVYVSNLVSKTNNQISRQKIMHNNALAFMNVY
ncbi:hypothetical protein GCHA_2094 [Paraglaciecola chathamensis S18K6]|uniref:Uncharacterized protein n=1 Tax=Paraglaciecola chathamensis S18K6 TaxID=1127672 RepID=A0AAV3UZR7_9ALTE|nr:hypothetical protein GCHA_2094 [Paraglaciecola chathamensis S18K6]